MSEIKIESIQKNFDSILQAVGSESFVNWEQFSKSSAAVINSIDEFNKKMVVFREYQHRYFIQTMKKLKSLDLPDLVSAVKAKKLPKEALRGIVGRFKPTENDKIELVEPTATLKQNASKEFEEYVTRNSTFLEELKKYQNFIEERVKQFGFAPEEPSQPTIKATVQFNLPDSLITKLASDIKIEYLPGTNYIGFKTYAEIVNASFDLVKDEYHKLTSDARKSQRENFSNSTKYLQIMNNYLLNGEALIIEAQRLIAKKLGLGENKLEESELLLLERGLGNHIMALQSQLRGKVKQCIPATIDVQFDVAKEVILFQTNMLSEKKETLKKIFDCLEKNQETVQTIPMLLALVLNDMVFQRYGYEEEDFMKNVSEEVISTHPELGKIFKDMEVGIIKLMQYIGIIPNEVGRQMEENAIRGAQPDLAQPGSMPGLMPGMMAGSNPMEMLQMQQMQQMQQMMAAQKQQQQL